VTTTAGGTSRLVTTERTQISMSDFEKEIVRLESASESINMLIFGDANAGKTRLAGTLTGKNFWLFGEPGWKSAARGGATGFGHAIRNAADAWAAVEWLEYRERYRRYGWVIIDGGSWVQERVRLNYAAEAFDINPTKRQHRNLPDKPDYFNTQNWVKSWMARMVDMPINLLLTCHAWRTDETDAELLVFPGIQGKVTETANTVCGLMDAVGYLEKRRVRSKDGTKSRIIRRLHFESPDNGPKGDDVRYMVGDKLDCLGAYIDNPTMPDIIAKISGEGENA
jgi:hypothetical protein